jgi:hypothetical protein
MKDVPKTLAKTIKENGHENLTLHNWMMVFTFVDQHPRTTQGDIVKHFSLKSDGALIFMQCTLLYTLLGAWVSTKGMRRWVQ